MKRGIICKIVEYVIMEELLFFTVLMKFLSCWTHL